MWQLIINGPGYFDTAYDLPEGVTTLGRADENDIVLSGDLVSRRHARISVNGDDVVLEDLGSRNGTRVSGQPLDGPMQLRPGDTVAVGENTLSIRQPSVSESAQTELVADEATSGIRRYGAGADLGQALILAKDVRDSVVLKVLDNVQPFDMSGPTPFSAEHDGEGPRLAYDSLLLLYRVAERLSSATSVQPFIEEAMDLLLDKLDARTAVLLVRQTSGAMVPAAVRHRGPLKDGEVPVSDAIIEAALEKGAALAVADVHGDDRFASRESVVLYGVDQVLCVPLGNAAPWAGALYLNKAAGPQRELGSLLDLCTAMGHLIVTGLEKFELRETSASEAQLRTVLARFHPPEIVRRRVAELGNVDRSHLSRLESRAVTTLAVSLAGSALMAQKLTPERMLDVLQDFAKRAVSVVFSFEGTISALSGDGVVAVFGEPYWRSDDALRAVRAALTLQAEWRKALSRRAPRERTELRIGLGTGLALTGIAGFEPYLNHAVIGAPLGIAQALASSGDPGRVLITGKTLSAIGARFDVTPLGEWTLGGDRIKTAVFEVLDEDPSASTNPGVDDLGEA